MNSPFSIIAPTPADVENARAEQADPGSFDDLPASGGIYAAMKKIDASSSLSNVCTSLVSLHAGSASVGGASTSTCRAVVPASITTGLVPKMCAHDFSGHSASFLDTYESA